MHGKRAIKITAENVQDPIKLGDGQATCIHSPSIKRNHTTKDFSVYFFFLITFPYESSWIFIDHKT